MLVDNVANLFCTVRRAVPGTALRLVRCAPLQQRGAVSPIFVWKQSASRSPAMGQLEARLAHDDAALERTSATLSTRATRCCLMPLLYTETDDGGTICVQGSRAARPSALSLSGEPQRLFRTRMPSL